jgi:NAD(P)H-quinone oxidoreductase subunit 3
MPGGRASRFPETQDVSTCEREDVAMLLSGYGALVVMILLAIAVPVAALLISRMLQPRVASPVKFTTFECGVEPIGGAWVQYTVRYYLYALVFLIFDIETVFLYPWAVAYQELGPAAMAEMFLFLAILLLGLAYAWKKHALEWV